MLFLAIILEGSTQINLGLSVRMSCTFLFASVCNFFSFDIITMDSPDSRNSFLPLVRINNKIIMDVTQKKEQRVKGKKEIEQVVEKEKTYGLHK